MKHSKSVMVIGASGFIGTHICLALRESHKVFGTYRHHSIQIPGVTTLPLDPLNRDSAKRVMYSLQPSVIIYACGKNDVQKAEADNKEAESIHANGAVSIATVSNVLQPKYIFLSNSYVFDGRKGNYQEKDIVLPSNALGKAKLNGENYIKGRSLNYVIVRMGPLYGRGNGINLSSLDHLRLALCSGKRVEIDNNELHAYSPINGFMEMIRKLVDGGPRNKILHYAGLTKITEFEFARAFAKRFGLDENLIMAKAKPVSKMQIDEQQPDFSLNVTEMSNALKIKPLALEEGFDLFEKHLVSMTGL